MNSFGRKPASMIWLLSGLLIVSSLQCSLATSVLTPRDQGGDGEQLPQNNGGNMDNPVIPPEGDQDGQNFPDGVDPGGAGGLNPQDQPAPAEYKLEGIWVSDTDTGFGTTMHTELILEYTGTFTQTAAAGDLMTWDVGTYVVGDGFIRFVVENHEPKEYLGQTMNWVTGFTYFYTFVDENTIIFEDHISGNSWYSYRQ